MSEQNGQDHSLVPEAGLEPAQGCPYRILSSPLPFSGNVYCVIFREIIRFSTFLLFGCARCALMVWAQYGHSKTAKLRSEQN